MSAVPRRLGARRFTCVAAAFEIARDTCLERQTDAAVLEPLADVAALFDRPEQGSPGFMLETMIQRSSAATRPGLFSRGTSTVAGSVRAFERSSTIST